MNKSIIMAGIFAMPVFANAQALPTNSWTAPSAPSVSSDIPRNGIFINADDFQNGIPEMGFDKKTKENHIREFDNKVILIENAQKTKFPKSAIWGYRKNNQDYRTFKNDDYAVAYAPKELPVIFYSLSEAGGEGNIKDESDTHYFFSRNSQTAIYPLTAANIKEVFSDQLGFVQALEKANLSDAMPLHEIISVLSEYIKNDVK